MLIIHTRKHGIEVVLLVDADNSVRTFMSFAAAITAALS